MTAAIEVENLRMRYGPTDVLHDVTFMGRPGEVLALLGPNGAGKSTTIEILEGFRTRSAGHAAVLGTDPARGDERWRARLGVVLQSWRDHGKWRVGELLGCLGGYYTGYATPMTAGEVLTAVGLTDQARQLVRTLSGGQRRRLDLAIGIIGRPDVLFLDEPTAGLDPSARREFHDLLGRLARDTGTTILLTTHDLAEAERLAGRIVVLIGGRIVADGTVASLTGRDEVRWTVAGEHFSRFTDGSTRLVHNLFREYGDDLADLEVRRASLEDAYLALVRQS
ncbi:ABC transporter ATP-binding protein [Actinoplanes sp. NPDC049265]|uniref:ABC transporter ATP-binding protein n=1 Tax=Actinoplanes sp. NPDC049265 TaxID=3363902 RepID=UPI00371A8653